jgi:hypothetical protein
MPERILTTVPVSNYDSVLISIRKHEIDDEVRLSIRGSAFVGTDFIVTDYISDAGVVHLRELNSTPEDDVIIHINDLYDFQVGA